MPLVSLWRKVLGPESGCCGQKRKARYRALRLVVGMAQRREGAIEYGEGRLGAFYAAFWHVNVGCRAAEPSDGLRGTGLLPLEPGDGSVAQPPTAVASHGKVRAYGPVL